MSTIILIDANSVGYAGQHATSLSSGDQPTSAIYNVLQNLRKLKGHHRHARMMYLWDERAQFRFDLLPDYKSKRDDTPEKVKAKEEYHSQQPYIQQMLTHLGVPQLRHPGLEADDLAFFLAGYYHERGDEVILVTSDKDWLQMVQEGVRWYDPRFDRWCDARTFAEFTGFDTVAKFVDAKCLQGDKSDCIPGGLGLGEKACEVIFGRFPNIKQLVAHHKREGGFTKTNLGPEFSRYRNKINALCSEPEKMAVYIRNRKLMDLSLAPKPDQIKITRGLADEDAFLELCGELAFHSVIAKKEIFHNLFFATEEETA